VDGTNVTNKFHISEQTLYALMHVIQHFVLFQIFAYFFTFFFTGV